MQRIDENKRIDVNRWAIIENDSWNEYLDSRDRAVTSEQLSQYDRDQYARQLVKLKSRQNQINELVTKLSGQLRVDDTIIVEAKSSASGDSKDVVDPSDRSRDVLRLRRNELVRLNSQLLSYIQRIESRAEEKNPEKGSIHSLAAALRSCNQMLLLPKSENEITAFKNASDNLKRFDPILWNIGKCLIGLVVVAAAALTIYGGLSILSAIISSPISHVATGGFVPYRLSEPLAAGVVGMIVGGGLSAVGLGIGALGTSLLASSCNFFYDRHQNRKRSVELVEQVDKIKDYLAENVSPFPESPVPSAPVL